MDVITRSYFEDFREKFGYESYHERLAFEYFVNYCNVSKYFTLDSLMENPLETDPGIPLVIDPPLLFFSSDTQMQAVGIKNRSSLHSA